MTDDVGQRVSSFASENKKESQLQIINLLFSFKRFLKFPVTEKLGMTNSMG